MDEASWQEVVDSVRIAGDELWQLLGRVDFTRDPAAVKFCGELIRARDELGRLEGVARERRIEASS